MTAFVSLLPAPTAHVCLVLLWKCQRAEMWVMLPICTWVYHAYTYAHSIHPSIHLAHATWISCSSQSWRTYVRTEKEDAFLRQNYFKVRPRFFSEIQSEQEEAMVIFSAPNRVRAFLLRKEWKGQLGEYFPYSIINSRSAWRRHKMSRRCLSVQKYCILLF